MKVCVKCNIEKQISFFDQGRNQCKACRAAYSKERRSNPDVLCRMKETNKAWRTKNKDRILAAIYLWRTKNAEAYHAINARSRSKNITRVMVSNGQRRAVEKRATPTWANRLAMREFYETAQELNMLLGVWHQVDHIVPLKNKLVCGLHCEANMRVITAEQNFIKNNRFWPDMPDNEVSHAF